MKGSVRLYKVIRRQVDSELIAEILDPVQFMLPSTIGEKDKGNIVVTQKLQSLGCTRDWVRHMQQDAIYTVPCIKEAVIREFPRCTKYLLEGKGKRRRFWSRLACICPEPFR